MDHMFVVDLDGNQLNSKCILANQDGFYGLILESWGQEENPQYNKALKIIIHRLQQMNISKIDVFLASKPVLKNIPHKEHRRLSNHLDGYFHINQKPAEGLRLELCKQQKYYSKDSKDEKPSGNGTKRIFLHSEKIQTQSAWKEIVLGEYSDNYDATENLDLLLERVSKLSNKRIINPIGVLKPLKKDIKVTVYSRSPDVIAFILRESKGICENCNQPAPFKNIRGDFFLEVHHVVPLSKGGPDTPDNCIALCPNCHRAMHYAENNKAIVEMIYAKKKRLNKY